jgi:hypothetical protein
MIVGALTRAIPNCPLSQLLQLERALPYCDNSRSEPTELTNAEPLRQNNGEHTPSRAANPSGLRYLPGHRCGTYDGHSWYFRIERVNLAMGTLLLLPVSIALISIPLQGSH